MAATPTLKNRAMAGIASLPGKRLREVEEILADKQLLEGIKKASGI